MSINEHSPIVRDALTLAAYALTVGVALLLAHRCTTDAIELNAQKILRQTVDTVLPSGPYDNNPVENPKILDDKSSHARTVYRAFRDGQPAAAAITAITPDGYAGQIDVLVGVTYLGSVSGVRVLSHRETPGLGDRIDVQKSQWVLDFNGLSLSNSHIWKVRKDGGDFDQFTGATITPRAVVSAVRQTLDWYSYNRRRIFEQ